MYVFNKCIVSNIYLNVSIVKTLNIKWDRFFYMKKKIIMHVISNVLYVKYDISLLHGL